MTPLAKIIAAVTGIAIIGAVTFALRPHPAPAVEQGRLTPAQLVEVKQPTAEPKPEPPKVVVAPPVEQDDDIEDGSGS